MFSSTAQQLGIRTRGEGAPVRGKARSCAVNEVAQRLERPEVSAEALFILHANVWRHAGGALTPAAFLWARPDPSDRKIDTAVAKEHLKASLGESGQRCGPKGGAPWGPTSPPST